MDSPPPPTRKNVGLLNLTGEGKLRTRTPVIIAAVLLLILGFVPKAGALLSVIPSAVVGGIFLPAAASLIVTGLRALRKVADDERRQTVIGMSLLLGIALPKALSGLTGGASVFFGNNIMVGVFSAIILNALFRRSSGFWWRSIVRRRPWMFQQPIRRMGLALRRTMNDNAG